MPHFTFFEQDSKKLQLEDIQQIPTSYTKRVSKNKWPYVVAYHFRLDPHEVMTWDNDSILEALASLKVLGVVK